MRRKSLVSPIILRDVYVQTGDYTAKFIIDPRESNSIETVSVSMRNADGCDMPFASKRWGTKLTVSFKIDEKTPDGAAVIDMTLLNKSKSESREAFRVWIVK